ncbi:MAG: hypothetical protein ACK5HR_05920 [Mycoplasmatales bacterium]
MFKFYQILQEKVEVVEEEKIIKLFSNFSYNLPVKIENNKIYQYEPLNKFLKNNYSKDLFEVKIEELINFKIESQKKNELSFIFFFHCISSIDKVQIELEEELTKKKIPIYVEKLSQDEIIKYSNGIVYQKFAKFVIKDLNTLVSGTYKLSYNNKIKIKLDFLEILNDKIIIKLNENLKKKQIKEYSNKKSIKKLSYKNKIYNNYFNLLLKIKNKKIKIKSLLLNKDIFEIAYKEFLYDAKFFINHDILDTNIFYNYKFMAFNYYMKNIKISNSIFKGKSKQIKEIEKKNNYEHINASPFNKSKHKILLIDNLRKILYKEEYIDPASKFLLANEDVLTLEYDYLNKHYNKTNDNLAYADDISMYEKSFDTKIILKYWDKEITDKLKKYQIYQKLINKYLRRKFPNYLINYLYYYQLLEQQKFQEVYVVGPYRPYIYAAASSLKIPKFEIQYAAIVNNHPAYFDVTPHKKDLPDKIIVYDKVWKNNLKNYIKDKNNIIVKSNKYFN